MYERNQYHDLRSTGLILRKTGFYRIGGGVAGSEGF